MITSGINNTHALNSTGTEEDKKKSASSLGQDAFLKLLTTQLQHQDPMQPKEDGEFLAQLAQFSSLEKLTEISTSIQELARVIQTQSSNATSADSSATGGK